MSKEKDKDEKSKFGSFLSKVGGVFPDIAKVGAAALSGTPIGAVLGGVTSMLGEKAKTNEQAALFLQELERDKLEFEQEVVRLQQQENESARKWNAQIQSDPDASNLAKYTPYIIDLFIAFIWGAMTMFIIAKAFRLTDALDADMTTVMGIYAAITGQMTTVLGFHRGSSIGSKQKDKLNQQNK